jgi:hypothetical protein
VTDDAGGGGGGGCDGGGGGDRENARSRHGLVAIVDSQKHVFSGIQRELRRAACSGRRRQTQTDAHNARVGHLARRQRRRQRLHFPRGRVRQGLRVGDLADQMAVPECELRNDANDRAIKRPSIAQQPRTRGVSRSGGGL